MPTNGRDRTMHEQSRKNLREQYKERTVVGGVFAIKNSANGRLYIDSTANLGGAQNRFEFMRHAGISFHFRLQEDWTRYGVDAFYFVILDELVKKTDQSDAEFMTDLNGLKGLRLQDYTDDLLY